MVLKAAKDRLLFWLKASGALADEVNDVPVDELVSTYARLKQESFTLPQSTGAHVDLNMFNPLSKISSGNPWAVQYDNQNHMNEIKLDVDRTHQEHALFQVAAVQKSLINILFVFGKVHALPYRQGMNEIGAVIFSVVAEGSEGSGLYEEQEGIAYAMLSGLMMRVGVADFFYQASVSQPKTSSGGGLSPLLSRCDKIFELLAQKDARLHKHLVMNDVVPNLFLLRWVRLLFAREFSISSTVEVWDGLFSHMVAGERLEFPSMVDYFAIAMVINVRSALLVSDNSGCFSILLKYPQVDHLGQLLDLALRVKQGGTLAIANPPAQQPQMSKRDVVLSDLSSIIADLRNSQAARSIEREIKRLEQVVGYLKPPASGR